MGTSSNEWCGNLSHEVGRRVRLCYDLRTALTCGRSLLSPPLARLPNGTRAEAVADCWQPCDDPRRERTGVPVEMPAFRLGARSGKAQHLGRANVLGDEIDQWTKRKRIRQDFGRDSAFLAPDDTDDSRARLFWLSARTDRVAVPHPTPPLSPTLSGGKKVTRPRPNGTNGDKRVRLSAGALRRSCRSLPCTAVFRWLVTDGVMSGCRRAAGGVDGWPRRLDPDALPLASGPAEKGTIGCWWPGPKTV